MKGVAADGEAEKLRGTGKRIVGGGDSRHCERKQRRDKKMTPNQNRSKKEIAALYAAI